ncbi:MAG: HAMP domain-containing histidine kinase [Candidatus Nitrosocosmicus sp.]|nr:HAMP domain-containing histidine kinase [Candidatus Nitrosocosmicus sp.]
MDSNIIDIPLYTKLYTKLKTNKVKISFITDITIENIDYCKELIENFGMNVKHLDGAKGNFLISDDNKEFISTNSLEKGKLVRSTHYSNIKDTIEQSRYIFETLWNKAIPAEQRFREIEEGLLPIETKILESDEEIFTQITNLVEKTEKGVSICSPIGGFQLLENTKPLLQSYKNLIKRHRGEGNKVKYGICWVTHIEDNKEQVALVKKFLDLGFYIKHLENNISLTFGVSEKQFQSTMENMINGKMIQSVLHSTEPSYIKHYQSVFVGLWNSAIDAEKRIKQIEEGLELPETKIAHGKETIPITDKFEMNCQNKINIFADKVAASVIIDVPDIKKTYEAYKSKSIKIRLVTEITPDNIRNCKEIIEKFGAEMRHLESIKGNFAISDDKEYLGSAELQEGKPIPQIIYSNVKEIVEQNKFIFETLWKKAIPAEYRIKEIEEGLLPIETKILNTPEEIFTQITNLVEKTKIGVSVCTSIGAMQLIDNFKPLGEIYMNLVKRHKEGKVKGGVRWITYIEDNKEQVALVKKYLEIGFNVRHLNNLPMINFGISDIQLESTIEKMVEGKMLTSVLHSTEPTYVQHFRSLFEQLWKEGIDAQERIRQIEKGFGLEETKVIENAIQAKESFIELAQNAREEIMILFPSYNAIRREVAMGVMDLLKQKSGGENIRIRILSPVDEKIKEILFFSNESSSNMDLVKQNISCREIRKQDYLISTIVIVDRKYVLATELRDDSEELFEKAIGLTTFSSSKPTVLSYISFFESLWEQTETSENLRLTNEKLVQSEETEREFINTAAHELRTPTQALTGYSELDSELFEDLDKNKKEMKKEELEKVIDILGRHHKGISRNAERLNNLIGNLLDVARIESNQKHILMMKMENIDLVKDIKDIVTFELNQRLMDKNIKINFINDILNDTCLVYADRSRVNQVLTNLLDNAIKFSNKDGGGSIDIMIQRGNPEFISSNNQNHKPPTTHIIKNELNKADNESGQNNDSNDDDDGFVYVAISDSGKGISNVLLPKVFDKFITDSDVVGTGLGLYISKKLVEAMGGRIWAFNNSDGIGATFIFSLPVIKLC